MASAFSGRAGRLAGMWAYDQSQAAAERGQGILDAARGSALAALGQGREAIGAGRDQGLSALGQNYDRARGDLNTQYAGAIDRLNPYNDAGQNALGTYQGSLGLGGQANRDAAVSAFRQAPGYQYAVDQATDAVARRASALGALGSGNTMQAISDRAQNMADQGYRDWQGQVSGLATLGQQAAGAQAGMQTQLGNSLASLGQNQGRDTAGLYTDAAAREAGLYGQEAGVHNQLAGLGLNNLWNGANAGIQAGTGALMAGQNAAANRLNLLGQGINFGTKLIGGFI